MDCRPGDLVEIWEGGEILAAVVLSEEKGRLSVVTEAGAKVRIAASRIVHRAGRAPAGDPRLAAQAAARHAAAARRKAEEVDAASLWELVVDEGGRHSLDALAALALGDATPESASALFRRLSAEKSYFTRKGDLWEARGREAVEETRRRIRSEEEKARRREAFLARARERLASPPDPAWPREDEPFLRTLTGFAVHGDEAPDRKEASALLADLALPGAADPAAAFDLLVRLGVLSADENLDVRRFGLRTPFPPEVLEAAEAAAARPPSGPRRDLTALEVITIDDEETVEIDDALSWEPGESGGGVAGIHIADPSAFVAPGDAVDEEALRRAATYYFPDRRLPMIPAALSEGAASLNPHEARPALSFLVAVDAAGNVTQFEIAPSIIRSRERLTYEAAGGILEGGAAGADTAAARTIAALGALAEKLEAARAAAGAIQIRAPEVAVKVGPGGAVRIERIESRGPARRLVAEMMILVNRLAARFCVERSLPAIYRRQAAPDQKPEIPPEGAYDPVAVRRLRRSLKKGEISLAPAPHFALGLPAYLQVTSPLRRYQDLAVQRQIEAHLAGEPLPYDAAALARVAATTEEAERAARTAEASADEYWILKYLAGKAGEEIEAVVLAAEPRRTEVELTETLLAASVAPRPDHVPGARLRLVVEEVVPRRRILRLREAGRGG